MKMKCFFMLFIPNIVVDGCHTCRRTRLGCTALFCLHNKEPAFQSTPEYNFHDDFLSLSPFAQPNMHFTPESSVRHTSRGDGWRMWMLYSFFEVRDQNFQRVLDNLNWDVNEDVLVQSVLFEEVTDVLGIALLAPKSSSTVMKFLLLVEILLYPWLTPSS